jgi:hypothetical protein
MTTDIKTVITDGKDLSRTSSLTAFTPPMPPATATALMTFD